MVDISIYDWICFMEIKGMDLKGVHLGGVITIPVSVPVGVSAVVLVTSESNEKKADDEGDEKVVAHFVCLLVYKC